MRVILLSSLLVIFAISSCDDSSCKKTEGGIEVCDGVDNDCNGTVDDAPDELCALDHAAASCQAGACVITACDDGWEDLDGRPSTGCEIQTMCVPADPVDRREAAPWFTCPEAGVLANATVVTVMDRVDQYFGAEDRRTVDATALFPDTDCWQQVFMEVNLECPANGKCDHWDRTASIALVEEPGNPESEVLELLRYITPYRVGMCTLLDVTEFASRLKGQAHLRSFVDTWVGPGSSYGEGWRVTVRFHFLAGTPIFPAPEIVSAVPRRWITLGEGANPVPPQLGETSLEMAEPPRLVRVRVLATGHGQGNAGNCAEFCKVQPVVHVDGAEHALDNWRYDCGANPVNDQLGTWTYGRQGWCPGAVVVPLVVDVTDDLAAASTISWDMRQADGEVYENTCQPGAGELVEGEEVCTDCTYGDDLCAYNGGSHTTPVELFSAQVFIYR